ncbi:MAG TPA: YdcF family protein [Polyangiaceae bacterium]|nr:YdcF family protein [Polyangiaceae bacterium]
MFFFLSKTLDELATPLFWALALVVIALAFVFRRAARPAAWTLGSVGLVLYAFSAKPVSNALLRGLEASARRAPSRGSAPPYDAVIVLGGFVNQDPEVPDYTEGIDRLFAGFDELRSGRARHVLLCGGRVGREEPSAEAAILERQLESWGIAPDRIVIDDRSRNTHQNAVEAARIVRERGWTRLLLVTSAFHFERAAGCFRRAGLTFDALPVDYRSYDPSRFSGSWLPRVEALSESTMAIREYVGRAVYSLHGYSMPWP